MIGYGFQATLVGYRLARLDIGNPAALPFGYPRRGYQSGESCRRLRARMLDPATSQDRAQKVKELLDTHILVFQVTGVRALGHAQIMKQRTCGLKTRFDDNTYVVREYFILPIDDGRIEPLVEGEVAFRRKTE